MAPDARRARAPDRAASPRPADASACETFRRTWHEAPRIGRPHQCRDLDRVARYADAVHGAGTTAAGPIRDCPRGGDHRPLLRVLDVMHRFLMIVAAEHEIDGHLR